MQREDPNVFVPQQFENPANPAIQRSQTAQEIIDAVGGEIHGFCSGIGTGGTITGTGRYLKEQNPDVKIIGVEPAASPLLTKGETGPHGLMGMGANFVPATLDTEIYDEVLTATEEDAYEAGRLIARNEGLLVGISSGAALHAALEVLGEVTGDRVDEKLLDSVFSRFCVGK